MKNKIFKWVGSAFALGGLWAAIAVIHDQIYPLDYTPNNVKGIENE